jgi:hypothetical protein
MPTATSRKALPDKKLLAERDRLCEERIKIERKRFPDDGRVEEIEARLKEIATETGSFKVSIAANGSVGPGKDFVSASGRVEAEFKGAVPVIVTEAWNALSEIERKRYVKSGLVKIEQNWGRASNGRVQAKVYPKAA